MDHEELVRSTTKELLNSFGEGALISRNRLIEWFAAKQKAGFAEWLLSQVPAEFRIGETDFSSPDQYNDTYTVYANVIIGKKEPEFGMFSFRERWKVEAPEVIRAERDFHPRYVMYLMLGPGHPNYKGFMRQMHRDMFGDETESKDTQIMKKHAEAAADTVNAMLQAEDGPFMPLKKMFDTFPGWEVPLKVDTKKTIGDRHVEYGGKGDGIDRLGEYSSSYKSDAKYPMLTGIKITLYGKAIEEYCAQLNIQNIASYYAYVLAHELFHALQDHMLGIVWSGRVLSREESAVFETQAEYFALQFVKHYLQDAELHRIILADRAKQLQQQMQWLIPYAEAVAIPSDEEFLQSYAAFCKDTLARCYGVSV